MKLVVKVTLKMLTKQLADKKAQLRKTQQAMRQYQI